MTRARQLVPAACALAVALVGTNVLAATVRLLRPAHAGAVATEAIVRLRGELVAAGFGVELADVPVNGTVRAAMEPAGLPANVVAVVALFGDDPEDAGALWVIDRATSKTVRRPIPTEPEGSRSAEILSIRALELLRASFLEAALGPKNAPPAGPAVELVKPPASPPRAPPSTASVMVISHPADGASQVAPARSRLAVEIGALALGSLDGIPPSVLPLVRAEAALAPRARFAGRLTVAGLGSRARITAPLGDAEVSQQLALVEALVRFRLGRVVQPFLSLGLGATRVSAEGVATAPATYRGKGAAIWAAVGDVGAGLRVSLGERFQLAGEVHAQRDAPYPLIRFAGTNLAEGGRPTLLGCLSVVAWL
ncbi:MAG TPA: hypothetical protein VGP07_16020 [Polyangia bacterium]